MKMSDGVSSMACGVMIFARLAFSRLQNLNIWKDRGRVDPLRS